MRSCLPLLLLPLPRVLLQYALPLVVLSAGAPEEYSPVLQAFADHSTGPDVATSYSTQVPGYRPWSYRSRAGKMQLLELMVNADSSLRELVTAVAEEPAETA